MAEESLVRKVPLSVAVELTYRCNDSIFSRDPLVQQG